ncbi:MAG: hypothetical protein R2795_08320 [Saprospiraceae bacterium]
MEDITLAGNVSYEVKEGVATITFFHPAHNSLPGRLLSALEAAIQRAGSDSDCRVVILKSSGERTFVQVPASTS